MKTAKASIAIAFLAGLLAAPPLALAQDEHSGHHPAEAPKASAQPATPGPGAAPAMPGPGAAPAMPGMGMGMRMMGPDHMKQMQEMHRKMMSGGMMPALKPDAPPSSHAFANAFAKMRIDMAAPLTGDADVDFARAIIANRKAALDLAITALQFGKDPQVRKAAEDIVKAQQTEIMAMTEWLRNKAK